MIMMLSGFGLVVEHAAADAYDAGSLGACAGMSGG